jgi:hypothetical protein
MAQTGCGVYKSGNAAQNSEVSGRRDRRRREAKVNLVAVQATNRLSHCGRGWSPLAGTAKMDLLDRDLIAIWLGGHRTGLDSVSGLEFGVNLHLRVIELG